MDTLRDVELQLSRVVQQRLLSCDALHSQTRQSSAGAKEILENIEKLQENLTDSTKELAVRVTQLPASDSVENELKAQEIEETQRLDSETETEDEFDQDKESFSGVGCKRMRESEGGDEEDEPETKHPFSRKERVAREKQLKVAIKKYTQSGGGVGKMDETAEKKELKQKMGTLDRASLTATARLVKFIEDGGVPSMDIATSFRDATILLPDIISRNQEQRSATKKWTMMILKRLRRILDLAKSNPKLPAPLSNPQLEAARAALNDHKGVYCFGLHTKNGGVH